MSQPRKTAILAGLLLLCLASTGGVEAKQKDAPSYGTPLSAVDKQHLLNDNFVIIKTVPAIPKSVQEELFGNKPRTGMADPGQPFQEGDVIYKPLPHRRLILAGTSPGYCFVYNEYGGIVYGTKVSLYRCSYKNALLVWRAYVPPGDRKLFDLAQLRDAIAKGKFSSVILPK